MSFASKFTSRAPKAAITPVAMTGSSGERKSTAEIVEDYKKGSLLQADSKLSDRHRYCGNDINNASVARFMAKKDQYMKESVVSFTEYQDNIYDFVIVNPWFFGLNCKGDGNTSIIVTDKNNYNECYGSYFDGNVIKKLGDGITTLKQIVECPKYADVANRYFDGLNTFKSTSKLIEGLTVMNTAVTNYTLHSAIFDFHCYKKTINSAPNRGNVTKFATYDGVRSLMAHFGNVAQYDLVLSKDSINAVFNPKCKVFVHSDYKDCDTVDDIVKLAYSNLKKEDRIEIQLYTLRSMLPIVAHKINKKLFVDYAEKHGKEDSAIESLLLDFHAEYVTGAFASSFKFVDEIVAHEKFDEYIDSDDTYVKLLPIDKKFIPNYLRLGGGGSKVPAIGYIDTGKIIFAPKQFSNSKSGEVVVANNDGAYSMSISADESTGPLVSYFHAFNEMNTSMVAGCYKTINCYAKSTYNIKKIVESKFISKTSDGKKEDGKFYSNTSVGIMMSNPKIRTIKDVSSLIGVTLPKCIITMVTRNNQPIEDLVVENVAANMPAGSAINNAVITFDLHTFGGFVGCKSSLFKCDITSSPSGDEEDDLFTNMSDNIAKLTSKMHIGRTHSISPPHLQEETDNENEDEEDEEEDNEEGEYEEED